MGYRLANMQETIDIQARPWKDRLWRLLHYQQTSQAKRVSKCPG